jgi:hypothetical protein
MWKNYEAVQLLKVIPSTLNGCEESDPKGHPEAKPKDLLLKSESEDSSQTLRLQLRARFARLGMTEGGN